MQCALLKLGVFGPGYFDGNIPILKEEIHTVILIPLWLCPGGGGGARGTPVAHALYVYCMSETIYGFTYLINHGML